MRGFLTRNLFDLGLAIAEEADLRILEPLRPRRQLKSFSSSMMLKLLTTSYYCCLPCPAKKCLPGRHFLIGAKRSRSPCQTAQVSGQLWSLVLELDKPGSSRRHRVTQIGPRLEAYIDNYRYIYIYCIYILYHMA
jgi:hypothetical protein